MVFIDDILNGLLDSCDEVEEMSGVIHSNFRRDGGSHFWTSYERSMGGGRVVKWAVLGGRRTR